jgi:ArsR family transcriptional regulator, nickel/cobalt-responsive transcriptional repressor
VQGVSHGVEQRARLGAIDAEAARQVATTMQALAVPHRIRLLAELRGEPRSVGQLVEAVALEQSAVSHHLQVLRAARLVIGERDGRRMMYRLFDPHVAVLVAEAVFHTEHVRLDHPDPKVAEQAS